MRNEEDEEDFKGFFIISATSPLSHHNYGSTISLKKRISFGLQHVLSTGDQHYIP
jgi:hypothetical protein